MKIFLTGGTGFIGQPLTRQLLARGWQVIALVRNPNSPQAKSIAKMGATLLQGDVTDFESMRPGMAGVDMVIHNAAWYELGVSGRDNRKMFDINVGGTEKTLRLAQELGIPRVIYVSSLVAMGDSGPQEWDESITPREVGKTAYHQSKADAHLLALDYQRRGLPLVIVCPGNVVGPNDHSVWGYFARMYINNIMPPLAWARDAVYRVVMVDDLAEGIALAAEKSQVGQVYFMGGDAIRMHEALSLWNQFPGGIKARIFIPNWLAYILFATLEPFQRLVGMPAVISRETVLASATNYNYSNQKARRELGWNLRPMRQLWQETFAGEQELKAKRKKRDLVSLLKPVDE
jgi:dihydroflavonol-4-reductase